MYKKSGAGVISYNNKKRHSREAMPFLLLEVVILLVVLRIAA